MQLRRSLAGLLMSEPPILPNAEHASQPIAENPFAPSSAGVRRDPSIGEVELGVAYWIVSTTVLLVSIAAISSQYFLGWGLAASTIAAAVRVPLLQRSYPTFHPNSRPANSLVLLCTSWVLVAVFMFVACIAFVVICVPGTIALGTPGGTSPNLIALGSGFAAFICFCTLLYLSLRLPI